MKTDGFKIGDTIKEIEKTYENHVKYNEYLVIRIDGHKFSKFTKKFKKPYDSILSNAMEDTTKDLVEKFGASLGYTQSDEITLIVPPIYTESSDGIKNEQIFNGRIQKIASLVASYTSIRFNFWLQTYFSKLETDDMEYYNNVENRIGTAWFDARVFGVETKELAFSVIQWRYKDAVRNSKCMFAQAYCSHRALLNKNSKEQIEYCFLTTQKDWNASEERYKYGIFVKKEKFFKYITDSEFSSDEPVERTRTVSFFKDKFDFTDENIDFVIRKNLITI